MGLETVAVYSEADAGAPHVAMADEALPIGPRRRAESYLTSRAILDAARALGRRRRASRLRVPVGERRASRDACADGRPDRSSDRRPTSSHGWDRRRPRASASARPACPSCPGQTPTAQTDAALRRARSRRRLPGARSRRRRAAAAAACASCAASARSPKSIAAARREAERAFGDGTLYVERLDRAAAAHRSPDLRATRTATSCTSASATARCSAGIRRWSKRRRRPRWRLRRATG